VATARSSVERALRAVALRENEVRAWAFIDPVGALAAAAEVDGAPAGPLAGTVLGVKDLFDTAGQPTEYGSPIFAGRAPTTDAVAVSELKRAGAVLLGKTVTSELGGYHPGPTTNPHDPTRTPGGSSMGSAAAVAAGMADIALGAQTAASVVRPASFCGVFGFKPTFGAVPTDGLRVMAPSLDTVGWFARGAATVCLVTACLAGGGLTTAAPGADEGPPVIGVLRTDRWEEASTDSRRAVEGLVGAALRSGAKVVDLETPRAWQSLDDVHTTVMEYEGARSLAAEYQHHRQLLSQSLRAMIERGSAIAAGAYQDALATAVEARRLTDVAFGEAQVVLTPAVVGEAPVGLPVLCLPGAVGTAGMPVGVQIVGRAGADKQVAAAGAWMEAALRSSRDGAAHAGVTKSIATSS
jgi:Asp-tRNA(Asn)/Glu-tRNA(Gln) amidotransferase A subunit family amidase